jgi:signal transduction histidine kinase
VSDVAATPAAAGGRVWQWLAGYLLLQGAVALITVLLLELPLPDPPQGYRLSQADLTDGSGEHPVSLPYHLSSEVVAEPGVLFAFRFDRPQAMAAAVWSVMIPRFVSGVEVSVNGAEVLDSRRHPASNRPDRNTPEIAVIPAALLKDGANALTVRLHAWGPLNGFLDNVYVGPDDMLRPAYETRAMLFLALPVVFAAWQAILAVLLGVMWLKRRHEPAYGILAAAMTLGVVRAFATSPAADTAHAALNAVLLASAPLEAACVVVFIVAFLGLKTPRYLWLVFAPGAIICAAGLIGSSEAVRTTYLLLGPATVLVSLFIVGALVGQATVVRHDGIAALLGSAVTMIIVTAIHDVLLVLDFVTDTPILVSRAAYSALQVAIGIGLTWRFAKALNEVDSFAGRMVVKVREAEDKLRASLAVEEQQARAAALQAERNRLMRDLHDGLGGQLVSIVALSERKAWEGNSIGDAARAALRDLRLVIDAMDDIDGDLMLALGAWRERASAQLRSHNMSLEWRVLAARGLPVHPELRPWHVIQILRLLDEAVTNAVKHSGAGRVIVSIETVGAAGQQRGRIVVEDNGCGFAHGSAAGGPVESRAGAARPGRGLANMRRRAARCGATLDICSGVGGTRVSLDLPDRFPAGEPASV